MMTVNRTLNRDQNHRMVQIIKIDSRVLVDADIWQRHIKAGLSLDEFVDQTIYNVISWLSAHREQNWPNEPLELSLLFTDDQSIKAINKQWRQIDKPTNVLSFPTRELRPGESPMPLMGDLIFAFETIENEAKDMHIAFDAHLTHLLIHGFLHLLGYDHMEDEDAQDMEAIETSILATFGLSDPYNDET